MTERAALSAARRLARWARGLRLADVPTPVVARAQLLALDTLGSCLASSTMDFGRAVTATALTLGGPGESTVIGGRAKVGAASAVLANATLAHGLDFDDTREDAIVHTGCVAVTAALAAGEAAGASGAAVVEALIAAVEVMCRVGLVVPGRFHARHFHPTSLTAGFAAATAAARLGALDEDQLVHAYGICGSQAGGIIEYLGDGSWTKRLHPGWTGHGGMIACRLARDGFTGPEHVFEGEHGFYAAFAGGHEPERLETHLASLGLTWELAELTFKPYPCGSIAHPYMDCAARLRREHRLDPTRIAAVVCRTAAGPLPRLWEPLAAKHRPPNGYAAKFSLPYLLASIFVRGEAGFAAFTDEAVREADVLAVAGRVRYEVDATIDYPRQFVGHVRVTLDDGRVLEARQDAPRGGPDLPLTPGELETKFRANAALRVPAATAGRIVDEVLALATSPRLDALAAALAG
ncbi:MAG: MmgE/PrpD family protein [Candidatus Rokubacteria bacterium]|nr:MmgE/PrpD family protein [Candidatus Rokubacteria bacterium]MBI3826554.1 MmgE/PrpD family protein [Candidatus Rokubacteria bacterium]